MTQKKSIVEQALLQIENIEDAVKQNAKGILASTMKQELNDLLKEQEDDDFIPDEEENGVPEDGDETTSITDELPDEDETSTEDSDEEPSLDGEFGDELGDEADLDGDDLGDDLEDDDEVLDMTGASSDEVAKIFKAMSPEDGIIVKKDDDKIELNVEEPGEYIIKLNEQEDYFDDDDISEENIYEIELDEDDEGFEGELDEDKNDPFTKGEGEAVKSPKLPLTKPENKQSGGGPEDDPFTNAEGENLKKNRKEKGLSTSNPMGKSSEPKGGKTSTPFETDKGDNLKMTRTDKGLTGKKGEQTEAARNKSTRQGNKNEAQKRSGLGTKDDHSSGSKKFKAGSTSFMNEEVTKLKKQNAEYRKALVLFKDKLNEVAVFNANLAYATRLFTEHTTTKKEKMSILKRFDSISTITESKGLYGQIKEELSNTKPITEAVADKIASPTKTSSSGEMLSESKVYENEQFSRMKTLMGLNK